MVLWLVWYSSTTMPKHHTEPIRQVVIRNEPSVRVTLVDQRTAERLPLAVPMNYVVKLPGGELSGRTKTTNISGGGVELICAEMMSPPSACQVVLHLSDGREPLALEGQISWCRQSPRQRRRFEVGITFLSPTNSDDERFARYCHFIATELLKRYLG
ncbi:MAG: hypothetical protein COV75_00740 [Candidatus Omnitrophica bacterium CG11_big_fil_rev_8_21_14_0_20_63_9]|nr:MAG: hypothetical protein COV75_00740 [Candidatus Omnitrophica bacterium CG11_big_fil_rev_8_21_14_0_20_63_9]